MGLVAATCFQHNPSTQPQAFTVLGYLASDEVDDDLVYQILVAMSTTLTHFSDTDNTLLISMLRCLCRIIPGLLSDSRYASSLFWLAVGILQLGYIPPFAISLELLHVSLKAMIIPNTSILKIAMEGRTLVGDPAKKLDQIAGISFETDISFSFVGVIFKGLRHPSTKKKTREVLLDLLRLTTETSREREGGEGVNRKIVKEDAVAFFVALLPIMAGNQEDLRVLWNAAGMEWQGCDLGQTNVLEMLTLP